MSGANNNDRLLSDLIASLLDDSISDEQFQQLDQLLKEDPAARQFYLDALQIHEDLPEVAFPANSDSLTKLASQDRVASAPGQSGVSLWQAGLAIALLLPIAFLIGAMLPRSPGQIAQGPDAQLGNSPGMSPSPMVDGVTFADLAHARFFGEMPPKVSSSPFQQRDYVLMEGMVELAFGSGASAIIEGPAVFRVESNEKLALDIGRCSVHAPDGAEGFQVETPEVNVVDRGTRFSVHVLEDNATEVQVVEGAADIYGKHKSVEEIHDKGAGLRLNSQDARRFSYQDPDVAVAVPFRADQYKQHLPDRIVAYEATRSEDGRAEDLVSIDVVRGGKRYHYLVDELIGSQVTHFHAQDNHGYLIGDNKLPNVHADFASDGSIRTGVINIGGSRQPLTESPNLVVDDEAGQFGTPGMAIRFNRPVTNGPGADVVLFELQMFSNPLSGDAFHVSPLEFRDGLHSHTVTSYDLTLESPEALQVATLYLQKFEQVPRSLSELKSFSSTSVVQAVKFHAIAVGIDLSDLGYPEGASVDGLFFQDALNDDDVVDPTFIAGFPEVDS